VANVGGHLVLVLPQVEKLLLEGVARRGRHTTGFDQLIDGGPDLSVSRIGISLLLS
jgi:hypothetical protein